MSVKKVASVEMGDFRQFCFGSMRQIEFGDINLFYGANGSGKSNFLDAIAYVVTLVTESVKFTPGQGIPQAPHKLEAPDSDSEYKMQFLINGVKFAYGFIVQKHLIKEEYLYYFPNKRPVKIFERDSETFTAGNQFRGKFTVCNDVLKPNRLMLSCAANFSNVPEVESVYRFFDDSLVLYKLDSQDNWMNYTLHTLYENPDIKKKVLRFMRRLSIDVQDIRIEKETVKPDDIDLPDYLSDDFKKQILQKRNSPGNVIEEEDLQTEQDVPETKDRQGKPMQRKQGKQR